MNTQFKNFIFNGLTYGILFYALSCIGYGILHFPLQKALLYSIPIGLVTLIVNGLIQTRFTKSVRALQAITLCPQDPETVKIEAPANHMIDDHLVSGKLFLTEKQLVFISLQQEQYAWPLANLQPLKFHWTIFNTGGEFIVEDESKNKLVFEEDEIKKWKNALMNS
jgi:hypothetical protein